MNHATIMGRLGRDPEIRYTPAGKAVVSFTLAVDAGKDRDPNWIRCVAWERTAEVVSEYVRKGQRLLVEGFIQVREYADKDGAKKTSTEVVANRVYLIERKEDGAGQRTSAPPSPQQSFDEQAKKLSQSIRDLDDDIPF